MKTTLVIGASENPNRYSYKAIKMLKDYGHEVLAYGLKNGKIDNVEIKNTWDADAEVDTVTMYVGTSNQQELIDPIIALSPKRVIFNPGTENPDFENKLIRNGIQFEKACTLVLLSTNQY